MAQSDYPAAIPALEEALTLFRELGDDRHAVFALCEIARALSSRDELDKAYEVGQDALQLAESIGDDRACSAALDTLAMVAGYSERHPLAQEYSERSLALRRSLGDAILITSSTNTLGMAAMRAGDLDTAERAFTECLELARGLGEQVYVAAALCALGEIALSRDLPEVAADAARRGAVALPASSGTSVSAPSACTHSAVSPRPTAGRSTPPASGERPTRCESGRARCRRRRRRPSTSASGRSSRAPRMQAPSRAHEPRAACSDTDELDVLVGSLKESPLTTSVVAERGESRKESVMAYDGEGEGWVKVLEVRGRVGGESRQRAPGCRACVRCPGQDNAGRDTDRDRDEGRPEHRLVQGDGQSARLGSKRQRASSTNRHSALASRMWSIVRQSTSSRRGEQTRYARHSAREIATLKRLREKRNSRPRGTSSPLELAIE